MIDDVDDDVAGNAREMDVSCLDVCVGMLSASVGFLGQRRKGNNFVCTIFQSHQHSMDRAFKSWWQNRPLDAAFTLGVLTQTSETTAKSVFNGIEGLSRRS